MLDLAVLTVLGVLVGVVTGLTPGLHPNTVIFFSLPFYFSTDVELAVYGCFISGLSVSHTFHDFIPSLFLGLPDSETALSTVPGLKMVSEGRGLEAFNYSVHGGLYAALAFVAFLPFLLMFAKTVYGFLEPLMALILLFFLLTTVFNTSSPAKGFLIASLSGMLGIISFQMPVNASYVFIPMFSGLFAVPVIVSAVKSAREIPQQAYSKPEFASSARGGITGFFAGAIAGIIPGIGASIATSFLAPFMEDSRKEFIAALGGVNTSDILISFAALIAVERARSGAAVALSSVAQVTPPKTGLLMGASLFAVAVSAPIALKSGEIFANYSPILPRRLLLGISGLLVLLSTIYLTGPLGLLVLFTSSSIGFIAMKAGDRRPCMAVLIVPAILFFAENGIFI